MADFRDRYALAILHARGWVRKDNAVSQSEALVLPVRCGMIGMVAAEVADDGASALSWEAGM